MSLGSAIAAHEKMGIKMKWWISRPSLTHMESSLSLAYLRTPRMSVEESAFFEKKKQKTFIS